MDTIKQINEALTILEDLAQGALKEKAEAYKDLDWTSPCDAKPKSINTRFDAKINLAKAETKIIQLRSQIDALKWAKNLIETTEAKYTAPQQYRPNSLDDQIKLLNDQREIEHFKAQRGMDHFNAGLSR